MCVWQQCVGHYSGFGFQAAIKAEDLKGAVFKLGRVVVRLFCYVILDMTKERACGRSAGVMSFSHTH